MSARLNLAPNLDAPDDFYEALIEAHHDLSEAQSEALNARLVLLLANHVGDLDVLREAFALARRTLAGPPRAAQPPLPAGDSPRVPDA